MKKDILKFLFGFVLLSTMVFTACEPQDLIPENDVTDSFVDEALFSLQEEGDIGSYGCYELVFPVAIQFPDSTVVPANDYDELAASIQAWKEANPDVEGRPTFIFPIEVISEEGEVITVNDQAELRLLKKECGSGWFGKKGKKGHRGNCSPCFDLVFPVTILFPDDTTAEADSKETLKDLVRDWKEANPDSDERPELVFPLDVEMEDGTIVTVNSQDELKDLKDSCQPE